jgi:hypothetical protein
MNTGALAREYDKLTPGERFPLIVSANARGDEAEADRLANSAGWKSFRQRDFLPHSEAFRDLAIGVFVELLDLVAELAERSADATDAIADTRGHKSKRQGAGTKGRDGKSPAWEHYMHLEYAFGFLLKTKADGWKLFCERRHLPPFSLWEFLPGWERLQRYLKRVEGTAEWPGMAFQREGMLRFMNSVRLKKGGATVTDANMISPEGLANDLDTLFDWHVERCGG